MAPTRSSRILAASRTPRSRRSPCRSLRGELVAALDQPDQLVDHRRGAADVGVVAVEGEHVPRRKIASEPALELAQDGVLGAGSSAAIVLSSVSWRRANAALLPGEALRPSRSPACRRRGRRPSASPRPSPCPSRRAPRSGLGDRGVDDAASSCRAAPRQVALDLPRLGLLGLGAVSLPPSRWPRRPRAGACARAAGPRPRRRRPP